MRPSWRRKQPRLMVAGQVASSNDTLRNHSSPGSSVSSPDFSSASKTNLCRFLFSYPFYRRIWKKGSNLSGHVLVGENRAFGKPPGKKESIGSELFECTIEEDYLPQTLSGVVHLKNGTKISVEGDLSSHNLTIEREERNEHYQVRLRVIPVVEKPLTTDQ